MGFQHGILIQKYSEQTISAGICKQEYVNEHDKKEVPGLENKDKFC
jgi:hypothetical protein